MNGCIPLAHGYSEAFRVFRAAMRSDASQFETLPNFRPDKQCFEVRIAVQSLVSSVGSKTTANSGRTNVFGKPATRIPAGPTQSAKHLHQSAICQLSSQPVANSAQRTQQRRGIVFLFAGVHFLLCWTAYTTYFLQCCDDLETKSIRRFHFRLCYRLFANWQLVV